MTSGRDGVVFRVLAGVGALIAVAWLAAHLLPAAREVMLDAVLSFLLTFLVAWLLWWASRRSRDDRLFWSLLATGWTVNLLGNIAWGVYEMVTGQELPSFSLIDVIYIARQLVILASLSYFLSRLVNWRWEGVVAVMIVVAAVLWPGFRSTLSSAGITFLSLLDFLSFADYPILDAALFYTALLIWVYAETRHLRGWVGFLTLAMASYGVANWIQFKDLTLPGFASGLPDLFWLLTDVLAGLAVVYAFWQEPAPEILAVRQSALARWLGRMPYLAGLVTIGLTAFDLVTRGGVVDPVLIGCAVIAGGVIACYRWRWQGGGN